MKKNLLLLLVALITVFSSLAEGGKPVVSILGDSYSTFEGYIPAGNEPWYFARRQEKRTDVSNVRETWWWQLINEGGYILGSNESYSGSTICYTGYRGEDYRDRSFITRLPRIAPSDILLIFGGTNDSWANVPLGEYVSKAPTLGHLYEFRPALGRLLSDAKDRFPGTRIVFILNTELKEDINKSVEELCRRNGVELLKLKDIEKISSHPSVSGMKAIKEQLLEFLKRK